MAAEPDATLRAVIVGVLPAHPDRVAAWRRNEPGAWGFLAGQALLAALRQLGRRLTDPSGGEPGRRAWAAIEATPAATPD